MAARERGEEVVTAPEDETPLVLLGGAGPRTLDARQRARVREDTASPLLIPAAVGLYAILAAIGLWSPLSALLSR